MESTGRLMQCRHMLFAVEKPIRTVSEYLLRWSYAPQRPIKRALKQSPVKIEQWVNDTGPAIAVRVKAEGASITGATMRRWRKIGTALRLCSGKTNSRLGSVEQALRFVDDFGYRRPGLGAL